MPRTKNATKADLDRARTNLTLQLNAIKKLTDKAGKENKKFLENLEKDFKLTATKAEDIYKLAESTHQFQATVEFADSLNESIANVLEAIEAGQRGDVYAITTHSLRSVSTILKGLGSVVLLAGPEAIVIAIPLYLLGALIDAVTQLVAFFAPEEESLLDKIDQLLRKHEGERELANMKASFIAIIKLQEAFGEHGGVWESRSWIDYADEMAKHLGNAIDHLDVAASWLSNTDNQQLVEDWTKVLAAYVECQVFLDIVITQAFFKAYSRALGKLTTLDGKALNRIFAEQVTAIQWCKSQYKPLSAALDRLAWPARNVARLFSIGENDRAYHSTGCIFKKRETDWSYWGGLHNNLTILSGHEEPAIIAWYQDGSNLEFNAGKDWKQITDKALSGRFRSLDISALSDAKFLHTKSQDQESNKVVVNVHLVPYAIDAEAGTIAVDPVRVDGSVMLQGQHLPDGVVRGFISKANGAMPIVQIAFLTGNKQVFATRTGLKEQELHAIGKPLPWCRQIFARDGIVWAMGSHEVAWLAYDAEPTDEWNKVFPDAEKLALTGNWDFIDLDPPGPDGMMVGTLKHQLLFWDQEDGWRKGNEDEGNISFALAKHDPHPSSVQLIELRSDIAERLDELARTVAFPLTDLKPAAATDQAESPAAG